jgi:NADH:ubiquinone oxidoreductase subunit 3 (subunit A)
MNFRIALFSTILVTAFAIILPWALSFKKQIHDPAAMFTTWGMGFCAVMLVLGFVWVIRQRFLD